MQTQHTLTYITAGTKKNYVFMNSTADQLYQYFFKITQFHQDVSISAKFSICHIMDSLRGWGLHQMHYLIPLAHTLRINGENTVFWGGATWWEVQTNKFSTHL